MVDQPASAHLAGGPINGVRSAQPLGVVGLHPAVLIAPLVVGRLGHLQVASNCRRAVRAKRLWVLSESATESLLPYLNW